MDADGHGWSAGLRPAALTKLKHLAARCGSWSRASTRHSCSFVLIRGSVFQPFGLGHHFREVITVFTIGNFADEFIELCQRDEALPERRLFRATNLDARALFNRLHIGRSVVQAAARARIQP